MDLNKLLCEHQVALHELGASASLDERRWAGLRAEFYADEIRRARTAFGRSAAFTWAGNHSKLRDALAQARRAAK